MEDNFKIKQCSENDALEFSSGTYRVQKIIDAVSKVFKGNLGKQLHESLKSYQINIFPGGSGKNPSHSNYFTEGVDCEILKVGSDYWQKGKFKINVSIEFIPDEPEKVESELDSVRQEINNY
ncbi:KGK domain protein [Hyella patelloides LEGE 07179]|uniref:KGK domain protein n=1 Tax=Hyella patelloides LEGE 07179 TaxID=945734 RepID=A0A563VZC1_9CYAN|nr:KGK domain-containing protein [Hyella patelloides]VEP16717.1 KGK domain protein [Hyella patelloides LEGE 07179]